MAGPAPKAEILVTMQEALPLEAARQAKVRACSTVMGVHSAGIMNAGTESCSRGMNSPLLLLEGCLSNVMMETSRAGTGAVSIAR